MQFQMMERCIYNAFRRYTKCSWAVSEEIGVHTLHPHLQSRHETSAGRTKQGTLQIDVIWK